MEIDWILTLIKVGTLMFILLNMVPMMIWVERRGSALMQNRLGPNRLGPFGLFQSVADAIKFIFKEDFTPRHVNRFYYAIAPLVSMVPSFMTFAVIPFAAPMDWNGSLLTFQVANLDVGVLYIMAVVSLGVYGIILAGWASNNKYSLLGSLRSSSQMISYELSMGLSLASMLLMYSSVDLNDITVWQGRTLIQIGEWSVPAWGFLLQPIAFIIFLTATYAETNRLPFDLPEGESEIVAGYHLEYGSMKFAVFFMAEYCNMWTAAGLTSVLFFGGWQLIPGMDLALGMLGFQGEMQEWALRLFQATSLMIKVCFFMWLFVWVRWTLPRFRYDQLMDLGWKSMLPLSLANIVLTAVLIAAGVM